MLMIQYMNSFMKKVMKLLLKVKNQHEQLGLLLDFIKNYKKKILKLMNMQYVNIFKFFLIYFLFFINININLY